MCVLARFFFQIFLVFLISTTAFSASFGQEVLERKESKIAYIKKAVPQDGFKVYVIGDSLGAGLWQGLFLNFKSDETPIAQIERQTKTNTGIVRSDRFNWMKQVKKLSKEDFQIAVMMFGANDAQSIRGKGKRYHYQTPEWEEEYKRRLDEIIVDLKKQDIAVYWVGLPNVQKKRQREYHEYFNGIFKERAGVHHITFIDTWGVTNDETGAYQPTGLTLSGKKAVLRARDGTHFTPEGYRVFARFVEDVLRKDIERKKANSLALQ